MRITEAQMEKVLRDKRYWSEIWAQLIIEAAADNRQRFKIQDAESRTQPSCSVRNLQRTPDGHLEQAIMQRTGSPPAHRMTNTDSRPEGHDVAASADSRRDVATIDLVRELTMPPNERISAEQIARLCYSWTRLKQLPEPPSKKIVIDSSKLTGMRQRST